jgi:hypothetical protein
MRSDQDVEALLEVLCARLPPLPEDPACYDADGTSRELKRLIRDTGRELKRLRNRPRSQTAPLARFREACRDALAGARTLERARRKIRSARRKLGQARS